MRKKVLSKLLPMVMLLAFCSSSLYAVDTDKPYVKSYHYIRVREPVRVNTLKYAPSPEDTAVTGIKLSGYNVGDEGSLKGLELGVFSCCDMVSGVQFGLISCLSKNLSGVQLGFFHNYSTKFEGLQLGFVNRADEQPSGLQLGFLNFSKKDGVQIGFLNFKKDGFLPIFPFINF